MRWLVTLGVIGLMVWSLYQYRGEFGQALSEANPGWLGLALALNLVASLLYVTVWDSCARQLKATGGFRGALVALSVAGAARYIPGGIWPVAGLVYFGPQVGLPRKLMPVLAGLAQLIHLLAALLVGVLSLDLMLVGLPDAASIRLMVATSLIFGLGLGTVATLPRYGKPLLQRLVKLEQPLELWQPAFRSGLFWLLNGLKLWVLALAFGPIEFQALPYLIWVGAITTLLSALFFFVPLGLGVVELSLGGWLALFLPWHQVVGIVALNRLLRTANDFFFLALAKFLP